MYMITRAGGRQRSVPRNFAFNEGKKRIPYESKPVPHLHVLSRIFVRREGVGRGRTKEPQP
jgi:hypothetical protein